MAHAPIIIENPKEFINNPRQEFYEESKNKIIGKKGMIIKGYVTEKDRIASQFKENDKYKEKPIPSNCYENNENKNLIKQSELGFKAKNTIEKINEEIDKSSNWASDRKIIDIHIGDIQSRRLPKSQLSLLNITDNGKKTNISDEKYSDFFTDNTNEIDEYLNKLKIQKELEKKTQNRNTNNKLRKLNNRDKESNQRAKHILGDLHHKTHFKAVSTIANYYRDTAESPPRKRKIRNRQTKSMSMEEVNFNENINEEWSYPGNQNKGSFILNKNPNKLYSKSSLNCDYYSLQYLKEIAQNDTLLKKNNEDDHYPQQANFVLNVNKSGINDLTKNAKKTNKYYKVTFKDNIVETDKDKEKFLIIDNHNYSKENQINVIANKILTKCNITKEKNENNNTKLKSGEGKLMITGGLSINEFERKLGLKPLKH